MPDLLTGLLVLLAIAVVVAGAARGVHTARVIAWCAPEVDAEADPPIVGARVAPESVGAVDVSRADASVGPPVGPGPDRPRGPLVPAVPGVRRSDARLADPALRVATALAEVKLDLRDRLARECGAEDQVCALLLLAWLELSVEHHVALVGPAVVREYVDGLLAGQTAEAIVMAHLVEAAGGDRG